ncbi:methyltransferase domain-containing protein [Colletotrichum karsti]|uniref:Methyltransferase domain-containing protein n=1 Tax=Colletotrichum karsti TaxID=1095194 RepID=A0A9P6IJ55_9PEZI|nr:methyltransferase domain-containing protein [Colletotrichum karsti]KAF9881020.1 methyltransferase domain-containing protein [Colletotrichum karsti]
MLRLDSDKVFSDLTAKILPWLMILMLLIFIIVTLFFSITNKEPIPREATFALVGISSIFIGLWLLGLLNVSRSRSRSVGRHSGNKIDYKSNNSKMSEFDSSNNENMTSGFNNTIVHSISSKNSNKTSDVDSRDSNNKIDDSSHHINSNIEIDSNSSSDNRTSRTTNANSRLVEFQYTAAENNENNDHGPKIHQRRSFLPDPDQNHRDVHNRNNEGALHRPNSSLQSTPTSKKFNRRSSSNPSRRTSPHGSITHGTSEQGSLSMRRQRRRSDLQRRNHSTPPPSRDGQLEVEAMVEDAQWRELSSPDTQARIEAMPAPLKISRPGGPDPNSGRLVPPGSSAMTQRNRYAEPRQRTGEGQRRDPGPSLHRYDDSPDLSDPGPAIRQPHAYQPADRHPQSHTESWTDTISNLNHRNIDDELECEAFDHFNIWTPLTGTLLPPTILKSLLSKERPRVADIGTGSGVWLTSLTDILPVRAELIGFDLDPRKFPPRPPTPPIPPPPLSPPLRPVQPSLDFRVHDVRELFPEDLRGTFDLVHVRLLALGLTTADWDVIVKNLVALLRPGGWLLWEDTSWLFIRAYPPSRAYDEWWWAIMRHGASVGRDPFIPSGLAQKFETAGLRDCDQKIWSTWAADGGLRDNTTLAVQRQVRPSLSVVIQDGGAETIKTSGDIDRIEREIMRGVEEKGVQMGLEYFWIWGQRPLKDCVSKQLE